MMNETSYPQKCRAIRDQFETDKKKTLASRLESLSTVAMSVSQGQLDQKVIVNGNDEIAFLGNSINTMTNWLIADIEKRRQVEKELRQAHNEIEEKVI